MHHKINTALDNRLERKKAYDQSGIFVQVADVDHPEWQIKFSDETLMKQYFEIFLQFMEGTFKRKEAA